ncbi:hypothetical protein EGH21_08205 [Halomicroarcula sp. F13]|uniref:Rubrerythrin-like domain-containing protein n=1 Tax=Haloarcula rubra TaxID=2487747 RepID=A0AAW4PRI3_9EURY|nr:hypothetical protein [Halomicroarcula rubra]MBX0323008.1 hypothetical protein [Halomicroarcula rubra]
MGDRDTLHVCRECGVVMATTSETSPRKCRTCGATNFSVFASREHVSVLR